jgi:hypothetical protein
MPKHKHRNNRTYGQLSTEEKLKWLKELIDDPVMTIVKGATVTEGEVEETVERELGDKIGKRG